MKSVSLRWILIIYGFVIGYQLDRVEMIIVVNCNISYKIHSIQISSNWMITIATVPSELLEANGPIGSDIVLTDMSNYIIEIMTKWNHSVRYLSFAVQWIPIKSKFPVKFNQRSQSATLWIWFSFYNGSILLNNNDNIQFIAGVKLKLVSASGAWRMTIIFDLIQVIIVITIGLKVEIRRRRYLNSWQSFWRKKF